MIVEKFDSFVISDFIHDHFLDLEDADFCNVSVNLVSLDILDIKDRLWIYSVINKKFPESQHIPFWKRFKIFRVIIEWNLESIEELNGGDYMNVLNSLVRRIEFSQNLFTSDKLVHDSRESNPRQSLIYFAYDTLNL